MPSEPAASGPCSGLRVLDFTTVVSGPICTQALGDLGADVIKVETLIGDISRLAGGPLYNGLSGFFTQFNRNKRSIALDLKCAESREVVAALVRECDVVIENFRPGVADRLGIGWEDLRAVNPRLVFLAISGFGPDGPYAPLPAYDHVVQGLAGMMPEQGRGGPPQIFRSVVADKAAGMTALSALLAALLARERGHVSGQRIDVPMLDAYAAFMLPELMGPESFPDSDAPVPSIDPYRVYPTVDGHVVGMVAQDAQYRAVCEALERPDWLGDERFDTIGARFGNLTELSDLLCEEIRKWPTEEFIRRARELGAPFAPVNDFAGFLADPQVGHSGIVEDMDSPDVGRLRLLRHPVRYGESRAGLQRRPPLHGEHSDEVLRLAGYDDEAIADLRRRSIVV